MGAGRARAEKKPPFSANRREQLLAFGLYVLAYLYLGYQWWALPLFTAGFIAAAEYLFREQKRSWESWVWLGCVLLVTGCIAWRGLHPYQYDSRYPELVNHEYILSEKLLLFILHIFAVYWLMSRSGRLTGGESGHLLPLDALYAFVIIPFKNFFLRIRCVLFALKPKKERKVNAGAVAAAVLAAFVVLVLLVMAMMQLSAADDTFSSLLEGLRDALTLDLDQVWFYRFLLSLPVGAYVFGLLAGLGRETPETMRGRGTSAETALPKLRVVPEAVWLAALGVFSALYLAFFLRAGADICSARSRGRSRRASRSRSTPVRGFFELCRVMAINFTLFWLVSRTARRESRPVRWMTAALLIESMLFAVVALSKLVLYIDCFGFTPKRLQSTWLVCVLLFGSACALYTHLTGKSPCASG